VAVTIRVVAGATRCDSLLLSVSVPVTQSLRGPYPAAEKKNPRALFPPDERPGWARDRLDLEPNRAVEHALLGRLLPEAANLELERELGRADCAGSGRGLRFRFGDGP
jgi:hypothetical protein